jgi:Zn-dependent protease with chaperone function
MSFRRLNPFAFPAETTVRFNLMIFALVMMSIDMIEVLVGIISDYRVSILAVNEIELPEITGTESVAPLLASLWQSFGFQVVSLTLVVLLIGCLLGAAYILFRLHPRSLRRTRHLYTFPEEKDPKFTAEIRALAHVAGVSPAPTIEVGAKSADTDGQVFGFKGHYAMRMGSRMPLLLRKSPELFRATVLHELAHIVNGDIGRTYYSQSLWNVVLALLAVPSILIYCAQFMARLGREAVALLSGTEGNLLQLVTSGVPSFLLVTIQFIGWVALLAALRGSLLRTREIYADWRAALWGALDGLRAIFEGNSARRPSWWSGLWRLHPAPQDRLRLLLNPRRLFDIPHDLPLLAGVLIGAASSGLLSFTLLLSIVVAETLTLGGVLTLLGGPLLSLMSDLVAVLAIPIAVLTLIAPTYVLSGLTAGSLGLQAQRDGLAAAALRERGGLTAYLKLVVPAALYAIGLQVGFTLSPIPFFSPLPRLIGNTVDVVQLLLLLAATLAWLAFATTLIWLWLTWGRYTAGRWMSRKTGPRPPHRRRRFLTTYLAITLWIVLVPLLVAQALYVDVIFNPTNQVVPTDFGILATVVGLALAAFIGGAGWLLIEMLSSGPISCPQCKRRTKHRQAVGFACEHCGSELAAWAFVDPATAG